MDNNWFVYKTEDDQFLIECDITVLSNYDLIIKDGLTREEAKREVLNQRFMR